MKDENHICIHGWMVNQLHLTGNDLICYALVFGFSQDEDSEFAGSLRYVSDSLGVSRDRARILLKNLSDNGLIIKREENINGVKFCRYSVNQSLVGGERRNTHSVRETRTVCVKHVRGVRETRMGGVRETRTNNIYIDNILDNKETSTKVEEKKALLSLATPSSINFEKLMDYFNNSFNGKLPTIVSINKKRKDAIHARASEYGKEAIFKVLKKVEASPFLLGHNEQNWRCDFDWIFRPTNFVKILEGNYDNTTNNTDTAKGRRESVKNLADLAVAVLQGTATKKD